MEYRHQNHQTHYLAGLVAVVTAADLPVPDHKPVIVAVLGVAAAELLADSDQNQRSFDGHLTAVYPT